MKSTGQRSEKYRELVTFVDERKVRENTHYLTEILMMHLQLDVSD